MSLEIMARISHYLYANDKGLLDSLLVHLPPILMNILKGGKNQILSLLKDMRPTLNKLNLTNINIRSYKLLSISFSSQKDDITSRKFPINNFIDLCDEFVCFHISEIESFIRFSYKTIHSSEVIENDKAIRLELSDPPPKLLEYVHYKSTQKKKKHGEEEKINFFFYFEEIDVCNLAHTFIITRVHSLKESLRMNKIKKVAIGSTKRHEDVLNSLHLLAIDTRREEDEGITNETVSSLSSADENSEEEDKININEARELKKKQMRKMNSLQALAGKKYSDKRKMGKKNLDLQYEELQIPQDFQELNYPDDQIEEFTSTQKKKEENLEIKKHQERKFEEEREFEEERKKKEAIRKKEEEDKKKRKTPSTLYTFSEEENRDPHTGKLYSHEKLRTPQKERKDFDNESVVSTSSRSLRSATKKKSMQFGKGSFSTEGKFDFPVPFMEDKERPMEVDDEITRFENKYKKKKISNIDYIDKFKSDIQQEENVDFHQDFPSATQDFLPESPEKTRGDREPKDFYSPSLEEISRMHENSSFLYDKEPFSRSQGKDSQGIEDSQRSSFENEFNNYFSSKLSSSSSFPSITSAANVADSEYPEDAAQDKILGMLIQEIMKIQKKRAIKKNLKLLELLTSSSASQLLQYLQQWKNFHYYYYENLHTNHTEKIKKLKATHQKLSVEMQALLEKLKENHHVNSALRSDILKKSQEFQKMAINYKKNKLEEVTELKKNIKEIKKRIIEKLLKNLASKPGVGGSSSTLFNTDNRKRKYSKHEGEEDDEEDNKRIRGRDGNIRANIYKNKGEKMLKLLENY